MAKPDPAQKAQAKKECQNPKKKGWHSNLKTSAPLSKEALYKTWDDIANAKLGMPTFSHTGKTSSIHPLKQMALDLVKAYEFPFNVSVDKDWLSDGLRVNFHCVLYGGNIYLGGTVKFSIDSLMYHGWKDKAAYAINSFLVKHKDSPEMASAILWKHEKENYQTTHYPGSGLTLYLPWQHYKIDHFNPKGVVYNPGV